MFNLDLSNWLRVSPPKKLPRLDRYLQTIQPKVIYGLQRALHVIPQSNGLRLLTRILLSDPVTTLTYDSDPWRAMGETSDSVIRSLSRVLDPEQSTIINRHLFVSPQNKCAELVFPIQRLDPYGSLPFGNIYNAEWKAVRPLRVIESDAETLTFDFNQGYLYYRIGGPTLIVFALDMFTLILKYLVYKKSLPPHTSYEEAVNRYIHDEVLLPCFSTDPIALWLRNQYRLVSDHNYSPIMQQDGFHGAVTGNTLGSEYVPAIQDVTMLMSQLKEHTVSVSTVLSSLWTDPFCKVSCRDLIAEFFTQYTPPQMQQYQWITGTAYLGWIEWFISLSRLLGPVPETISVKHRMLRDITLWMYSQPWQHINDVYYKDLLRQRADRIMMYLDSVD